MLSLLAYLALLPTLIECGNGHGHVVSYESLPAEAVFPGPWDNYIQAPRNKSHIVPVEVHKVVGDVLSPENLLESSSTRNGMRLSTGGRATFTFAQNIAGRVCLEVDSVRNQPYLSLSYSESPRFADGRTDASGNHLLDRDLNLLFPLVRNGTNCVDPEYIRGGFKYLTITMNDDVDLGFWHKDLEHPAQKRSSRVTKWINKAQNMLGLDTAIAKDKKVSSARISSLWVNCTAFPSNPNPRAYTGYFHSSSNLLNRVWYAGAYTLQLSTLVPQEGSALIDYNRRWDHNQSPIGSWYSNFSIANGTAVTTDGAKRDRMVWPGDMSIAAPGIAVSTYDLAAVRNALNTLFDHQYFDGSLPYAGPPMGLQSEFSDTYHLHTLLGAYIYVLYSGDLDWLKSVWSRYKRAVFVSINKVDEVGLLHVTSGADWLRPGMTGHNGEVSAIFYDVLLKSIELAKWIDDDDLDTDPHGIWAVTAKRIQLAMERIYCPDKGLFADNIGRRNCGGPEEVLPQDGNSWIMISGMLEDARPSNMSSILRRRWNKYGAPAAEFPNVISPFIGGFELIAHCRAGNVDAAVELMEVEWGYMLDGPDMTNSTCIEGYRVDGDIHYAAYPAVSRNSHAHGWSSGPTMVLLTEVQGIHLDSPLGRTWHITPHLSSWLAFSQGGFATKLGKFEVKMKRMRAGTNRSAVVLDVRTPPGTHGSVSFHGVEIDSDEYTQSVRLIAWNDIPRVLMYWELDDVEQAADPGDWAHASVEINGNGKPLYVNGALNNDNEGLLSHMIGKTLLFDESWERPESVEREPGVVDWEALEKYATK